MCIQLGYGIPAFYVDKIDQSNLWQYLPNVIEHAYYYPKSPTCMYSVGVHSLTP